jgi:hypothetical protein
MEGFRSLDEYNAPLLDRNMSCTAPGREELTRTIKKQPEASAKVLQENTARVEGRPSALHHSAETSKSQYVCITEWTISSGPGNAQ